MSPTSRSEYRFVYRSVTIKPPLGLVALSFRLEVDGKRIGNNEMLVIGRAGYDDRSQQESHALPNGHWASPRGAFAESGVAADVVESLAQTLDELVERAANQYPDAWPHDEVQRTVVTTTGPAWPL